MRPSLSIATALAFAVAVAPGCRSSELVAPEASEPLPVSVQHRTAAPGESIPTIHATAGIGSLTLRVTRHALCATIVDAAVNRGVDEIDVVAHVWNNPAALCAATIPPQFVVDYAGTVSSLPAGTYRLRVFEGVGKGPTHFIGSMTVTVPPPPA